MGTAAIGCPRTQCYRTAIWDEIEKRVGIAALSDHAEIFILTGNPGATSVSPALLRRHKCGTGCDFRSWR